MKIKKIDNDEIINILKEEGIVETRDINQSIYIMTDGRMISGMFDCNIRGIDHRIIESVFEDFDRNTEDFWDVIIEYTGLAMYVPETKVLLLKPTQILSKEQNEIVSKNNLDIEFFNFIRLKTTQKVLSDRFFKS